jgi:hypothetical protein
MTPAGDGTVGLCDGSSGDNVGWKLLSGEAVRVGVLASVGALFACGVNIPGPCIGLLGENVPFPTVLIPLEGILPLFMKMPSGLDQGTCPAPPARKGGITGGCVRAAMRSERLRLTIKAMMRMIVNRKSVPTTPATRKSVPGELVVPPLLPEVVLVVGVEFSPVFCAPAGVSVAPAVALAWAFDVFVGVGSAA